MMRAEILVRQGEDFIVDDATETRYQLASVSKQFTAAAALLLVEDGRLLLDDPGWYPLIGFRLLTDERQRRTAA
ncbi:serine hydrolase [Micromonospora sp. NPDC048930]|uniref:serine hydrolase n=1 Tax=Micromonospora sp. NPDC048930 TaxID=3364261 RepID=UPI0037110F7D